MRIASLVPGATHLVARLGLRRSLVGVGHACGGVTDLEGVEARVVTRCRLPAAASNAAVDQAVRSAGASRTELHVLDAGALREARPSLVIVPAARSEARPSPCLLDPRTVREALAGLEPAPRLLEYGPTRLGEVLGSVRAVGEAVGRGAEAARLVADLKARIERVRRGVASVGRRPRVGLLSWLNPPIGPGGLLAELVRTAGGQPVTGDVEEPPRVLDWSHVVAVQPEVLLLAPCDHELRQARAEASFVAAVEGLAETPAARWGQVHVMEARRWLSAAGAVSVDALELIAALVHPQVNWPEGALPRDAWSPLAVG